MKKLFFLLLLSPLLLARCTNRPENDGWAGKSYAQRDLLLDSLASQAPGNFQAIDSIRRTNTEPFKNEATLHIALAGIVYSHNRYDSSSTKLAFLEAAVEKARKKGWKELYAATLQQLANYTWVTLSDKNKALQYYDRAYQVYRNFDAQRFPGKLLFLFDYAGAYFSFEAYDKALAIYNEALAMGEAGLRKKSDEGYFISTQNTIALCYRIRGDYNKALDMFHIALASAEKFNSRDWITIIKGNIGATWHFLHKPDIARPLLEEELARGATGADWKSAASAQLYLAEIERNAGNTAGATAGFLKARQYARNSKQEKGNKVLKTIFDNLAAVYSATGNYRQALLYTDSAKTINDSIQKKLGANILLQAQSEINEAAFAAEKQAAEQASRYTRNSLIAGIVLLGVLSGWFIIRQRAKYNRRQKIIEAEKERITRELELATKELNLFARSIEEKNQMIEQIAYWQTARPGDEEKYAILARLEKSVLLTDEQWNEFTGLFEKVHGSFLQRLKNKAPALSPAEIRIIALGKLKLSNKAMAGMLGITPDAVRMNKFRLRKKLNLEEEAEFEKFLDSI